MDHRQSTHEKNAYTIGRCYTFWYITMLLVISLSLPKLCVASTSWCRQVIWAVIICVACTFKTSMPILGASSGVNERKYFILWCTQHILCMALHMVKDHSDSKRRNLLLPFGYSFRLAARVLLYALSYRHDSTYYSLCYTSHGALAGMRNSSMGPPWGIDSKTHCTMSRCSTTELYVALKFWCESTLFLQDSITVLVYLCLLYVSTCN